MSSWVGIFIIVFVVAMAFGPLMWFRSTPAERRMVAARKYAAELGMQVRLQSGADLDVPGVDATDQFAGYCLTPEPSSITEGKAPLEAAAWRLIRERISHETHFQGYWNWYKKRAAAPEWHAALRDHLPQLPADAVALDYQRGRLCIFWREKGGREGVERVATLLRQILEQAGQAQAQQMDTGRKSEG